MLQERFKHGKSIPAELAIIVGQGQHAQEEGPKLRDAVEQLLHQQLHMPVKQLQQAATQQAAQVSIAIHCLHAYVAWTIWCMKWLVSTRLMCILACLVSSIAG